MITNKDLIIQAKKVLSSGNTQVAIATALIAIAEALVEQNDRAGFQAEVEEIRQERKQRDVRYTRNE